MSDLVLVGLTLLWGTTFTLVKVAMEITSPGIFLAARFGAAALVLGLVALARRDRLGPGFWRHGVALGLFMLAGFALQTVGLRTTTPARSGFITGLSVLVVPFVARFRLGRPVRAPSWAGAALAVVGLALLADPLGGATSAAVRLGDALTAGCAVAFALQITYLSEWSPRHPPVPLTLLQIAVVLAGGLAMLPLAPARIDPARLGELAGLVAFTGVAMTAGAFLAMTWAQRHTAAVRAALIYALEPVAAAAFSRVWIGERLPPAGLAGGALVVLGVVAGEVGGALEARRAAAAGGAAPPG